MRPSAVTPFREMYGIPEDVPFDLAGDMIAEANGKGTSQRLAKARRRQRWRQLFRWDW
jgi:hypothetical protein